jgi:threonine dehydratase
MHLPTFTDVLQARKTIAPYLHPTPLYYYKSLSEIIGAEIWIKHENHQPIGAFKVRGGINFVAHLDAETKARGVITASTGNHGQSVAYSCRLFGVKAIVAMPNGSNPVKVEAIRNFGAEIRFIGEKFDESRAYAKQKAEQEGMHYLSPGDEPLLISGVGTYALEIIESLPDVDTIIVPVGGGSGASGACIVAKSVNPKTRVIGVQAEASPAAYLSWKEKRWVEAENKTFAEGLATGAPFELPQQILRRDLDDFVLVSEDELKSAMILAIEKTRNLVEPAGAASLAAAIKLRESLRSKKMALVMSGGNLDIRNLKNVLNEKLSN